MPSFSTKPYEFTLDGDTFTLPRFAIEHFDELAKIRSLGDAEQTHGARDLILNAADDKTADAIRRMSIRDVLELFKDWSTALNEVVPGESQPSTN